MFYQNMPLYLKLTYLLKTEYVIFHHLPKEYKFSLGQEITDRTWKLIDLFILAQTASQKEHPETKLQLIKELDQGFDCLKLRIRFLSELKLISLNQWTAMSESLVEIGKMIGSWRKFA